MMKYGCRVFGSALCVSMLAVFSNVLHAQETQASSKTVKAIASGSASESSVIATGTLTASATAVADHDDGAQKISQFTLKNGLEVIVIPNHRVPAVSHMMWYRVGAADDPVGKSGLAHFHEHLMFQGTKTTEPGEYAKIIAARGGQQNAFTGRDATSYYVNIRKEALDLVMKLEADRMRAITPEAEKALKEREVIIEERRMRVENNPDALLAEQVNAALFRNHPHRIPVIGWKHEMAQLTLEDVLAFHETYYHPNNAILIISGDVTAEEMKKMVQRHYGTLPRGMLPTRKWLKEPPQNAARRVSLSHENVRQESWYRDYVAPSLAHGEKKHALPLYALAHLLGGGKTSILYKKLVVEKKLATYVAANYSGLTLGPSEFSVAAIPAANVSLETIEAEVDAILQDFVASDIDAAALTRAKTLLKAQTIYARDGLSNMANIMGWLRINGLDKEYFNRWPSLIDAITEDEVLEAARYVLKKDASVTATLLPKIVPAKISHTESATTKKEAP